MRTKARGSVFAKGSRQTPIPISMPAGNDRRCVPSRTKRAASPAPTTIPTATIAVRNPGTRLFVIFSATGTQAMTRKRSAAPAPQNSAVPTTASRAFGLFSSDRVCETKALMLAGTEKFTIGTVRFRRGIEVRSAPTRRSRR